MEHFVGGHATSGCSVCWHGQDEKESWGGDLKKKERIFSGYLENIIIQGIACNSYLAHSCADASEEFIAKQIALQIGIVG